MGGCVDGGVGVGLDFCMRTVGLCDCDVTDCIKIVDCGMEEAKIDTELVRGVPMCCIAVEVRELLGLGNVQRRVDRVEFGVCVRGLGGRIRKRYEMGRVANLYASRIFEYPGTRVDDRPMSKRMEESEVWDGGIGDVSGIVLGQIWLLGSSGKGKN